MLDQHLEKSAVVGAGGKMGRGIALVLLQEICFHDIKKNGWNGSISSRLSLIDTSPSALEALEVYLKPLVRKYAERHLDQLKELSPTDIEESRLVDAFERKAFAIVQRSSDLSSAKGSQLIFEAAVEDIPAKTALLKELKNKSPGAYFLTNTSSIPISLLDREAELKQRIIGFHFYNPPPVQNLVEVIEAQNTDPELKKIASELGKRLRKTLVPSRDIAGFIGNGHFLRDIAYACDSVRRIGGDEHLAVATLDEVSGTWMLRPMGVFQLLDYVGVDVAEKISKVMTEYVPGLHLDMSLLSSIPKKGGQTPSGAQKDGFFSYEGREKKGVWCHKKQDYVQIQTELGALPSLHRPWKELVKDPHRENTLKGYFQELFSSEAPGARYAREFLLASKGAAEALVSSGVAASAEDVNTVLVKGFHHLYGPINPYF